LSFENSLLTNIYSRCSRADVSVEGEDQSRRPSSQGPSGSTGQGKKAKDRQEGPESQTALGVVTRSKRDKNEPHVTLQYVGGKLTAEELKTLKDSFSEILEEGETRARRASLLADTPEALGTRKSLPQPLVPLSLDFNLQTEGEEYFSSAETESEIPQTPVVTRGFDLGGETMTGNGAGTSSSDGTAPIPPNPRERAILTDHEFCKELSKFKGGSSSTCNKEQLLTNIYKIEDASSWMKFTDADKIRLLQRVFDDEAYTFTHNDPAFLAAVEKGSWADAKKAVLNRYTSLGNPVNLKYALMTLKQKDDEDVRDFGNRILRIAKDLFELLKMDAEKAKIVIPQQILSFFQQQEMLGVLFHGMRPGEPRTLLKAQLPNNFTDALQLAHQFELSTGPSPYTNTVSVAVAQVGKKNVPKGPRVDMRQLAQQEVDEDADECLANPPQAVQPGQNKKQGGKQPYQGKKNKQVQGGKQETGGCSVCGKKNHEWKTCFVVLRHTENMQKALSRPGTDTSSANPN
jgi:hypothetical protein